MGGITPKKPIHKGIYKKMIIYETFPPYKIFISTFHRDIRSSLTHDIELSRRVNDASQ
jgi:hypothetical protein